MKTLKIKTRFAMDTAALNDAELGRLIRGMLQYASSGTEPTLGGAERALWPAAKADIDAQLRTYANQCGGMEKTRSKKSTQISTRNLIDIYQKSNRYLPQEKEESGEREEAKEKRPPHTPPVKERQEEKEGKEQREHTARARGFVPPTLEEVQAYCRERNSPVDPFQFWEYFDTGRWIDSKGQPVRNWKQKMITWERMGLGRGERAGHASPGAGKVFDIRYDVDGDA